MRIKPLLASIFLVLFTLASPASPLPAAPEPDIVGGAAAEPGAYPFMAAVVDRHRANAWYGLLCGGVLIGPEWVATSASCVLGRGPDDLDVVTGRHDLTTSEGRRVHVAAVEAHPGFHAGSRDFDLALLRLATPVPGAPLTLHLPDGADPGTSATVAGWGDTETPDRHPRVLHHASLRLLPDDACTEAYGVDYDAATMHCAGDPAGGPAAGICDADTGGPLLASVEGDWVLLGLAGWGIGCGQAGFPDVFTDTGALRGWIHSTTGLGGLTCAGRAATIVGTAGPDFITGTDGDDVIVSLGGSDQIDSLDGDDTVCSGEGSDRVAAGNGADVVYAGPGNDVVDGGPGADTLFGEGGSDRLTGSDGPDTIDGGPGLDTIIGGNGDDDLRGGSHRDRISAGDGNDDVQAAGGDDIVVAGPGDDTVRGGSGADTIVGGPGADRLLGDLGNDTIGGGDGDDTLIGGRGGDTLDGGAGADLLGGGLGPDALDGGPGDDVLDGGEGDDVLDGGPDDDILRGRDGDDTLIGGLGDDGGAGGPGVDGCFLERPIGCELRI